MHHSHSVFVQTVDSDRLQLAARRQGELEAVLRAASAGDAAAWTTLVDRFSGRIRAATRAQRLSSHDAEDVMQITWLRLVEHIATIHQPGSIGPWIAATARREAIRTREERRGQVPLHALTP